MQIVRQNNSNIENQRQKNINELYFPILGHKFH